MSEKNKLTINCQNKSFDIDFDDTYSDDNLDIDFKIRHIDDCELGELELTIKDNFFSPSQSLNHESPVKIFLSDFEKPEMITALYLFSPWWTRPAFLDSFKDIPEKTQFALFKYKDDYGCLIPMVGDEFKAYLTQSDNEKLGLELTAGTAGYMHLNEPLYIFSRDKSVYKAVKKAFSLLAKEKGIDLKEKRRIPEIFDYLGWCSWNAFYQDVDQGKLEEKVDELIEKEVPVKWIIIDDGWLSVNGRKLTSFEPDHTKFPNGFKNMIEKIREKSPIEQFGVWMTLVGYWEGIDPESELAQTESENLFKTVSGKLVPAPENGDKFFYPWFDLLKQEGIDFIKVDSQSSLPYFFKNSLSLVQGAEGLNRSLEKASSVFDGAVINCMGMAMENVVSRKTSAVSRNSDDFFPNREESFKEHLLQNAYNGIYHDNLYNCDWDMFWTDHPENRKHALLRAISGGPIYFSDEVGKTKSEVLEPLIYSDGKILRMDHSALPTEDCIFIDPLKDGVLKLMNTASWGDDLKGGGIALFNLTDEDHEFSFKPSEIIGIDKSDEYWVYDYFKKEGFVLGKDQSYSGKLDKDGHLWFVILPKKDTAACLGLIDKYIGFTAIESQVEHNEIQTIIIKESGPIGFLSLETPKKVLVNSVDRTKDLIKNGNLFTLDLPVSNKKTVLSLIF